MKRLYLVDFDRSLFDTARFQTDLTRALTEGDTAQEAAFVAGIPRYSNSKTGFYDFFEHASATASLHRAQIMERLEAGIPEPDYTFDDAREWASRHQGRHDIVILSVGGADYQALKFKYAPSLGHLPRHVIRENKSLLLQEDLAGSSTPPYSIRFAPGRFDEIVLIDDLATHLQHLPGLPGISGIHLARAGGKYSHLPAPANMKTIRNLGELS